MIQLTDIGRKTPQGSLVLPDFGDWSYCYAVAPGSDTLNPLWSLYIVIGEIPDPDVRLDFTIASDGRQASIRVESEQVRSIPKNSKFWLMLQTDPGNGPGVELLTGRVV